jgi:hypothetical protein
MYNSPVVDPRRDEFCQDMFAIAHIIGERQLIDWASRDGVPKWKTDKTVGCFAARKALGLKHGR